MDKLSLEEFKEELKKEMLTLMPKYECCEETIFKINDQKLTALTFIREGECFGSTIYAEHVYEAYSDIRCQNTPRGFAQEAVSRLLNLPKDIKDIPTKTMQDLSFETIRRDIFLKVVDRERNTCFLKDKVVRDVGCGYALIPYIKTSEHSAIAITAPLMESEGYDEDEIFKAGETNAETETVVKSMLASLFYTDGVKHLGPLADAGLLKAPLEEIIESEWVKASGRPSNILEDAKFELYDVAYVVTNKKLCFGASNLFINGLKEKLYQMFGTGYYVLPGSQDEILVMPKEDDVDVEGLKCTARNNIYCDAFEAENILSDKVCYFDGKAMTVI